MKRIALAAFLLVLVSSIPSSDAQVVGPNPPNYVKSSSKITWDPVTTDVQGNPETVVSSELAISLPTADLHDGGTAIKTIPGTPTEAALQELVAGLKPGNYRVWARVLDGAGNRSDWSLPFLVTFDEVNPAAPVNITIKIEITVTPGTP